ncbi:MAG: 2-succinyl-5-enolpyruvyl-6-hydroxy-3-cyclohexene-1-carboxylic-acid synthase [Bacteroides sp.]|jgi:2-succinyl-5-enolpyruvyl-6-hydroxy-3-cyclohexene-1-carboxylate synthase|nr:2-succinyl-5-enolpyruvyl-6-hydroxy-3-cyclohexene-1-carboxylic-acid synthase [Bacteroides sp.]
MLHDRMGLEHLAELMHRRGISHLVISPGSRNAPIIDAFCKRRGFECKAIVDERSAAFFALGMAQQLKKPVAIACTSGTAPLNFAPAIAEAYYQRIPLLVLTADRPVEYIDQGDGQTIRQQNVFANFIRKSIQFPQSIKTPDDLWYANRLASEALNACTDPVPGPVHINLPFSEPLYGVTISQVPEPKDFAIAETEPVLTERAKNDLLQEWKSSKRKLLIIGQQPPDEALTGLLQELAKNPAVAILTEATSNLYDSRFIAWIDRCLAAMPAENQQYGPDLLITFGGAVVSKRIKSWLRKASVKHHWHIDQADRSMDTYQHLSRSIPMTPRAFLRQWLPMLPKGEGVYAENWLQLSEKARKAHNAFLQSCPYTDLSIFQKIVEATPANYDIHLANSTPVRYAQLFEYKHPFRFDSNRGVSGIDGSISTAAGAAFISGKPTLIITGDLGFFYDSNALWNKHLPATLKIIVINNGGGGIFRYLEGPSQTGLLEDFFEASHDTSAEYIAKAFGLDYFHAFDEEGLTRELPAFFRPVSKASILEVKSPAKESAATLRKYFRHLAGA